MVGNLKAMPDMLFISHALPEDNEFARWLALRLAKEGYPVWCDLTKLLGGEDFWRDIQEAIRNRTVKFLFVLSRVSNEKQGTLQELSLAKRVGRERHDFVIPLRIDDLSTSETTIELGRLNSINFFDSWVKGFSRLLEKLEEDSVPKDERFCPTAVAEWWREHTSAEGGVVLAGEACASNWFTISDLPQAIWLHSLEGEEKNSDKEFPISLPNQRFKGGVFTFENAELISERLESFNITIAASQEFELEEFERSGSKHLGILRNEARNIITYLLRRAFEMQCMSAGLQEYSLSGESKCLWFPEGFSEGNRVSFVHLDKRVTYRRMVGYKTLQPKDGHERSRTWHFAIQAKVVRWPTLAFAIKTHVVFSEAGKLYESKERQHSARRGQCKMWYNDTWLDRMLAAMSFLADPACRLFITVPLGPTSRYTIQTNPLVFESPVSYEITEISGVSADLTEGEAVEDVEDDDEVSDGDEEVDSGL